MNKLASEATSFITEFTTLLPKLSADTVVGIAPPFTAIPALQGALKGSSIRLGAQNAHWLTSGAHTGEISLEMLIEFGVDFVIIGHSERRQLYGERNEDVAKRAAAALNKRLLTIVCVGESEAIYREKQTSSFIKEQLTASLQGITDAQCKSLVIAYEPIWAIGTGLAATPETAEQIHAEIHSQLTVLFPTTGAKVPIIYGGSTSPDNISGLCAKPHISGALVGGASLKADVFCKLISEGILRKR